MGSYAQPGFIRRRAGLIRTLWGVPDRLLASKGKFLGEESDRFIKGVFLLRSVFGLGILAAVALAYPGYTRPMSALWASPANTPTGEVSALKLAQNTITFALWASLIILLCALLFTVPITLLMRPGRRLAMLRNMRFPVIAFMLFWGFLGGLSGILILLDPVFNDNPKSLLIAVAQFIAMIILVLTFIPIFLAWYLKSIYLAAVDVFRADDAHPLLAPVATTVVSWTLAIVALLAGGPTGLPRGLALLIVLGGPTTVSILNAVACVRLLRDYHCLLFRDGPGRYSREEPRTTGHSRAGGVAERRLVISAATGIAVLNLLLVIFIAPGTHQPASASSRPVTTSLRWSFTAGGSYITDPAVAGGTIYIGSDNGQVYALDAATGKARWTHSTGGPRGFSLSRPAVAEGVVVVGSEDGTVYALDAATGSARWSYPTAGSGFSNAAVAGGSVYIGSEDGTVYALDAATGKARWASPIAGSSGTDSPGFYGPAVAGGSVYIARENGTVYALDAASGKVRWSYPTEGRILSAPAVADSTVYVGSDDDRVYALNAATGKVRWTHLTGSYVDSAPAVADGTVYIGSDDGRVYALNAATGKARWTFPTANFVSTNPVVAGHTVYVSGVGRTLYALQTAS